ncbi:MAG: GNAT family N-acetyltransferase [Pseudomonadales bacterium]|nr:GNAT family N-acetyltransferase [Pseudomonadales bacterium]
MSSKTTTITTDRLTLRPPNLADAETIFSQYVSDAEVTRYLGWPRHTELTQTQAFIEFSIEKWEQDQIGPYIILDKLTDTVIGGTGLELTEPGIASTGYVLARDSWGRGYATEALRAMVELARNRPIDTVFALCHPEHAASIRVLEKCDFHFDARLAGFIEFPNLQSRAASDALKFVLSTKQGRTVNLKRSSQT